MTAVILDRLIRVGIVDDNELVRTTLHTMIGCSPNLQVVAEAANGAAGLSLVELMKPDVKVVVLSAHNDQACSGAALQAGACKFLTHDCGRENLLAAITECSPGPSRFVGNPPH